MIREGIHYSRAAAMRVDVNGTRLWFDVDGPLLETCEGDVWERPTVVLVHGGPGGFDHSYFKPDFARLTEYAQVVYLDLRGHGRSDWGDAAAWSFEDCGDDIRAFCDAVGIAQPIVLGHSMGAPIVLLYAARHPGHAAGIIVQSGFARWDHGRLVEGFRRAAGDEVAAIAARSYAGEDVADDDRARVYAAFGTHQPDRDGHPVNADLNRPGMDIVRATDIVDQLGRITSPTLVCVGALDPVTPVGAAEEVAAALPDGRGELVVIEGAGHFTWLDAPERFWPAIIGFVERTVERLST
jgi:pimeloyl-ACP methyl ester carboxylesterase